MTAITNISNFYWFYIFTLTNSFKIGVNTIPRKSIKTIKNFVLFTWEFPEKKLNMYISLRQHSLITFSVIHFNQEVSINLN